MKFNINLDVVKSKNNLEIARKYHHYDNVESMHITINDDTYHIDAVVSVFNHPQKCSLDIKDNQVLSDKDVGEDITKESEIIEEDINEEDDEFDEDDYDSDIIEDEDYNTINNDSDELLSITSDIEDINAVKNNDGNIIAETLDITRINNMADYLNSYSEQDKPLIAKMLRNGELKYACR